MRSFLKPPRPPERIGGRLPNEGRLEPKRLPLFDGLPPYPPPVRTGRDE